MIQVRSRYYVKVVGPMIQRFGRIATVCPDGFSRAGVQYSASGSRIMELVEASVIWENSR